jgi:hypothetical protein
VPVGGARCTARWTPRPKNIRIRPDDPEDVTDSRIAQAVAGSEEHGGEPVGLGAYFRTGHVWEALFENWESEFLPMAA